MSEFEEIYESLDEDRKKKFTSLLKRMTSGMTREEEINMWSILISVLKNWGKTYDNIDWILNDAGDIKNWIKNLE